MNHPNQYHLLIVEDDRIIREGLCKLSLWSQLGFQVIGAAASAQEALCLAAMNSVDVVLTDIKMSGMSGLDLIEQMQAAYPDIFYVILTGYSEFEYARRAVSLNVVEYLTKPVDPERLKSLFSELAKRLSARQIHGSAAVSSLKGFLRTVLEYPMPREHINARLNVLGLPEDTGGYQVLLLEGMTEDAIRDQQTPPFNQAWQTLNYNEQKLYIFHNSDLITPEALQPLLPKGCRAGLSSLAEGLHRLHERRTEAEAALNQLFFTGEQATLSDHVPQPAKEPLPAIIHLSSQQIGEYYNSLEEDRLEGALNQLCRLLKQYAGTAGQAKGFLQHLGASICARENLPYTGANELQAAPTLDEAEALLLSHIRELLNKKRITMPGKNETIPLRAKEYIAEHLSDKLSLEEIAAALYVNPSYLSRAFKKEFGVNISAYANEQKLEKAKEYMRHMDIGIYDIALRVGFSDYSYFCVLFKKYTGETPLSYRKRILYGADKKK